jgi:hypothetical protein
VLVQPTTVSHDPGQDLVDISPQVVPSSDHG